MHVPESSLTSGAFRSLRSLSCARMNAVEREMKHYVAKDAGLDHFALNLWSNLPLVLSAKWTFVVSKLNKRDSTFSTSVSNTGGIDRQALDRFNSFCWW